MGGFAQRANYVRYLCDVIWQHGIRTPKHDPSTYIHSTNQGNRYFYLALRFLTGEQRHGAVLSRKPWVVGPSTYGKHMDAYARLAYTHPYAQFRRRVPRVTGDKVLVHDGQAPHLVTGDWGKVVKLDYDLASPPPGDGAWMVMPYSMHPLMYATGREQNCRRLRQGDRSMRLFFAGNVDEHAYTSSSSMKAIRARFGMIDRARVISALVKGLGDAARHVGGAREWHRLLAAGPVRAAVLAIDPSFRVGVDQWLETLAACDVFLAPPGVFMPLCHNVIEAMAVGCIPLTNYADWFTPRLTHMKNCIEFTDEEDLVGKAKMVLELEPQRLAEMRASVADYYDRYLDPDRFLARLFAHPAKAVTLFMITERRSTWERVGADSILLENCTRSAGSHSPFESAELSPALSALAR